MRIPLARLVLALVAVQAGAAPPGQRFVSVAFHDIVDGRDAAGTDGVTTARLAEFFDWLKGTGWTAVSLDDVSAAARGDKPLPRQAILITFDDGFRSLYTRAYPLLKAYRFPAVAALVGSWVEPAPDGTVQYGDQVVPRDRFVSWEEAREMQASGLVEFASHSYDLHRAIQANPQGNQVPAAIARHYDAAGAYEDDTQYRARIQSDLARARELMAARLGRPPRALVWPYGRYTGPALELARQAGFSFALTLEPEPASTSDLFAIHRYLPSANASLDDLARNLRFEPGTPTTRRIVCLRLETLAAAGGSPAAQDAALGHLIDGVRALGATTVVLDAHAALTSSGAPLGDVYFPTALRPLRANLLSRASWQIRTRAGCEIFLRLPIEAARAAVGDAALSSLFADMVRNAPSDGVAIDMRPPAGSAIVADLPGEVRARRAALDLATLDEAARLGLTAYRGAAAIDPRLRLMIFMQDPAGPPDWADVGVLPRQNGASQAAGQAERLRAGGWMRADAAGRVAFALPAAAGQQVDALRRAQRLGAAAFALCPDPPALPASPSLVAAFSASTNPHRR